MDEIVWEDPPPKKQNGGRANEWAQRLAPLRERPGVWAKVGRFQPSTATWINNGSAAGIDRGEFEAVSRDRSDDKPARADIYVRFIGKPSKMRSVS